jgi:AcrR family transcriptional regulator
MKAFSERPYEDVSIDDVARAAKISKGLLYHYFPNKRVFYAAVLREGAAQLLACTEPDGSLPALEQLDAGLDAYLEFVDRQGPAYTAIFRGAADPEVARVVEETRAKFLERILEAVDHHEGGAETPITPRVEAALRGWCGFVERASLDWVDRHALSRAELRGLLVAVLVSSMQIASVDVQVAHRHS